MGTVMLGASPAMSPLQPKPRRQSHGRGRGANRVPRGSTALETTQQGFAALVKYFTCDSILTITMRTFNMQEPVHLR